MGQAGGGAAAQRHEPQDSPQQVLSQTTDILGRHLKTSLLCYLPHLLAAFVCMRKMQPQLLTKNASRGIVYKSCIRNTPQHLSWCPMLGFIRPTGFQHKLPKSEGGLGLYDVCTIPYHTTLRQVC